MISYTLWSGGQNIVCSSPAPHPSPSLWLSRHTFRVNFLIVAKSVTFFWKYFFYQLDVNSMLSSQLPCSNPENLLPPAPNGWIIQHID